MSAERWTATSPPPATAQEVFDRSLNHLRAQGCISMSDTGTSVCAYWNKDGLHCAIGIFIRPEEYRLWMEGKRVDALLLSEDCPTRLYNELLPHLVRPGDRHSMGLLERIQGIHDRSPVSDWEYQFQILAEDFNLTYTPKAP